MVDVRLCYNINQHPACDHSPIVLCSLQNGVNGSGVNVSSVNSSSVNGSSFKQPLSSIPISLLSAFISELEIKRQSNDLPVTEPNPSNPNPTSNFKPNQSNSTFKFNPNCRSASDINQLYWMSIPFTVSLIGKALKIKEDTHKDTIASTDTDNDTNTNTNTSTDTDISIEKQEQEQAMNEMKAIVRDVMMMTTLEQADDH